MGSREIFSPDISSDQTLKATVKVHTPSQIANFTIAMGRRKKKTYITLDQAATVVQLEEIKSRSQYWKWWDMYQPDELPKFPNKVYKDWISWNDFLNTNNKFKNANPHEFRTFEEALVYARSSPIATQQQWFDYNGHPDDVPARPDIVYKGKGFKGWGHFLGKKNKAAHLIERKRVEADLNVLLFAWPVHNPPNIIHISVHPGVAAAKDFMTGREMKLVKMFKLEPGYDYMSVVKSYGSDYGDGEWLFNNVDQMLFDIDLDWVRDF